MRAGVAGSRRLASTLNERPRRADPPANCGGGDAAGGGVVPVVHVGLLRELGEADRVGCYTSKPQVHARPTSKAAAASIEVRAVADVRAVAAGRSGAQRHRERTTLAARNASFGAEAPVTK